MRTSSDDEGLPNYDIRTAKGKDLADYFESARTSIGKNAVAVADIRDGFIRGEEELKTRIPTLKVEYNEDIRTPEVIAPDVKMGRKFLTAATSPSGTKHAGVLINFLKQNSELVGASDEQINALKVFADYTNPDGNLSYVELEQEINGIPVFRGVVKASFTRQGEMFRVNNNFAPGLDYESLSTDFRNPTDAIKTAAGYVNVDAGKLDLTRDEKASSDLKVVFGTGDSANMAEKMYFPTEPGVARPAWRVLIYRDVDAYYVIVDAETGTMLWRKNIVNDQTQSATYNVYSNTTSLINALDSPAPITPGPFDPSLGTQGVQVGRNDVTLIGNEGPLSFNNLGWITDGTNGVNGHTDGNAVQAGLDLVAPDGIDAPQAGTNRVFSFAYNPPPGMPAPPTPITDPLSRSGAVTQLFYLCNRYHDIMYQLGFTELARNFQNDNFGRGGVAADRVRCEAQDFSGTNNANFATPADGGRGIMQMYRFTNTPDARDGTIDGDVVIHEFTHGLSNRLVGNAGGLTNNRGQGMGEGWSDFYGVSLLSEPTDPINGIYSTGAYATFNVAAFGIGTNNSYYGIRRMPYAVLAFTGGPMNRPHNPRTAADVNTGCSLADGAFPPLFTGTCNQVHNTGEIWVSLLMEVRAKMIQRLGHDAGNRKTLQIVTDGMKLTPNAPNFQTARDAILAAAQASALAPEAGVDVADVWAGFALRGLGFNSSDNGTVVVENFGLPNAAMTNPFTVSDSPGNNNGFPEPGENVLLSVAITNTTGSTVNSVVANVNGGPNVAYGNIANGATVTMQIPFAIPGAAACGSTQNVTINVSSALGANTPEMRSFVLGNPQGIVQNFDGAVVPALPAGWTTTQDTGTTIVWATTATGPSSAPNSAFANDPATPNISSLVSPVVPITSTSAQLKFKNKYVTEPNFDGMVLEMKIGAGAFQDIIAAGGSFVSGGYNSTLSTSFTPPFPGRMAWSGTSAGGYIDTVVNLPAAANGQNVQFRWRMGSDASVSGTGVNIDDVQIVSSFTCAPTAADVEVSGRVLATVDGRGLRGARVVLRDENGNETYAFTGAYGTFRFPAVETGHTYILSVMSRRFQYAPQVLAINDNVTDLVFSPQ